MGNSEDFNRHITSMSCTLLLVRSWTRRDDPKIDMMFSTEAKLGRLAIGYSIDSMFFQSPSRLVYDSALSYTRSPIAVYVPAAH